jgi:hypothetical protein
MTNIYLNEPGALNISVDQNTDDSGNLTFQNSDGSAVDLTAYPRWWLSVFGQTEFQITPTFVGSPTLGVLNIAFTKAQLAASWIGAYELWSTDTNGADRRWAAGTFNIKQTHG